VTTTNGKAPPTQLRRRYAGEEAWFPLLEKVGHGPLRAAFIECGVEPQVAGGLVFFLEDQITLSRHQAADTRKRYRKVLRGLDLVVVEAAADKFASVNPPIMYIMSS
jgi:hypothetical protein